MQSARTAYPSSCHSRIKLNPLWNQPMTQKHDNLINGQWLAGNSYSPNLNPSNLADVIGEYAQADATGLDAAVQAAQAAFPAWSTSGIQARSDALDKIGTEILARREELGTLLSREEGKTKPEGIGEATRAGHIFKFFAGAWRARRFPRCALASVWRSRASPSVWSA
jgi:aldehyde dehydrogenase (NAD+)